MFMLISPKYRTILISATLFLTFDIGVLIPNFLISSDIKQEAVNINLSGRQRMLSQRMTKALLQVQVAKQSRQDINKPKKELNLAINLFDSTLTGFDVGGKVTGGDGKPIFIKPMQTEKGRKLVKKTTEIWQKYKQKIQAVLEHQNQDIDTVLNDAIAFGQENNLKILDLMNQLTTEQQEIADHKAGMLQIVQLIGLNFALCNFFIMLFHSLRKLRESDAELAKANNEIVALNQQLKTENLHMVAELNILRQMQQMILPNPEELENIKGLDLAGYMEPADEVGGDYYDVLEIDGVVTLAIGDVTGHGLESGILMLMTQTAVRTLKEIREVDPVIFLNTLNHTIYKNAQRIKSDKSLSLSIINYTHGQISISGQHEETIIVRKGGIIERINTMDLGFPIGLDEEIKDFISYVSFELNPGDGIVLYTDGITEAENLNQVQYQIGRLCEVISENWHKSAAEIKDDIITDLRQHIGQQKIFDDITLLVLKRQ